MLAFLGQRVKQFQLVVGCAARTKMRQHAIGKQRHADGIPLAKCKVRQGGSQHRGTGPLSFGHHRLARIHNEVDVDIGFRVVLFDEQLARAVQTAAS